MTGHEVIATGREECDLLNLPETLPYADTVYIVAAITKPLVCERMPESYRVNVDAPREIARMSLPANIVFLSSDAVENAIHTAYGMQKAHAEMRLQSVCAPVIVRISKVTPERLGDLCNFLVGLCNARPGVYHW